MNLRPMTHDERKYSCDQSMQLTGQTGYIGCLDGVLESTGLRSGWTDRYKTLNTKEFQDDRDTVFQSLQRESRVLADRCRMQAYCLEHLDSAMDHESREYGFRLDTDKYAYLLRLVPREARLYLYCYVREWLDGHMECARKGIRFITSHYDDLFRLRDGDRIRITTPDGRTLDRTCRYIDDTHVEVGSYPRQELYHICQFAELMERAGNKIVPIRAPACAIKNLSQLKKCLKAGSVLEIIGHRRPEYIGQLRKVTLANTQGFYSIVDGQPSDSGINMSNGGKGLVLDWSKASFWTFQDGVCGIYSDKEHAENSLIMAFRVLDKAA